MGLETFDQYRAEAESERGGLRGFAGMTMSFVGFIILANAFLVALLFRHLLSFRTQIVCAAAGAVIGVGGLLLRGNKRSEILTAAIASIATIAATVIVTLIEERFGLLILIPIVLLIGWLIQKLEERAWKLL